MFQREKDASLPMVPVKMIVQEHSQETQVVVRQNNLRKEQGVKSNIEAEQLAQTEDGRKLKNEEKHFFVCETAPDMAKRHQPIVMVSNSRTGSNLFFSFIGRLAEKDEKQVDGIMLYEVYADELDIQVQSLSQIIDHIQRGCGWNTNAEMYVDRKFASPKKLFTAAFADFNDMSSQQTVLRELQQVFAERYSKPAGFMQFIHRIPSLLPKPFFALKVFPYHIFDQMNMTVAEYAAIFADMNPEYVVLWRRNILEIFVSLKIAKQKSGGWTLQGTTKDDAIAIQRPELEWYIQNIVGFYKQARDYFDGKSIPYHEYEYNRDMVDEKGHPNIARKIQSELLHLPSDEQVIRDVFAYPHLAKQATVPISEQIQNWNEVNSWGYSAVAEEWPNLFPKKILTITANNKASAVDDELRSEKRIVVQESQPRNKQEQYFVCETAPATAKRHQPIVLISHARTGSNLFFSFIGRLAERHVDQVDGILLYEVYAEQLNIQVDGLSQIIDHIQRGCGWNTNAEMYVDRTFASPKELFTAAFAEFNMSSQQTVLKELQKAFTERYSKPAGFMNFIHRIPSLLPKPFFALKVFPYYIFHQMKTTVAEYASIFADMSPEYVVLWRRNVLEIFVSANIAQRTNGWTLQGTSQEHAITIQRPELDWYIQNFVSYFTQARDYFDSKSIPYHVFEYNRDLVDEKGHPNIARKIQSVLLHLPSDEQVIQDVFAYPHLAKQATVPVFAQIQNWDEVKSWGYSAVAEEWPDLFAESTNTTAVSRL